MIGKALALAQVGAMISLYAGEAALGKLRIKNRDERLRFFSKNVGKWSARALKRMNFEIEVFGRDEKMMREKNFLIISNHLSYLDILVMSSIQPTVFVTSVDMGEVFFLGTMAELGGSIFIERRHRGQIDRDLGVMSNALRAGHNVMLYPEGTSSNGQQLLPFKKSLMMAAVEAECDVLPVCIKYTEIDGEPFGVKNADKVCWYGDMTFGPHFLGLFGLKRVKVELHFLDPIKVTAETTRNELADRCHQSINSVYTCSKLSNGAMPTVNLEAVETPSA
jgi:1-acyl-sn-glycerol-3-phosphate acyltransferase